MTVSCPSCGRTIAVPPDKAGVSNLKARCRCGQVMAISAAGAVPVAPAGAAAAPSAPPPVPRAVVTGAAAAATPLPKIRPAAPPPIPPAAPLAARPSVPPPVPISARPSAPVAAPAMAPSPGAAPAEKPRAGVSPSAWRRCTNHRQAASDWVCPACQAGFCDACTKKVQSAAICPQCEGLCVGAAGWAEVKEKERQRSRSMMEDLGVIASYPLRDPISYVMLAVFTWFFGLFSSWPVMYLLSKGVLVWYSFNALSKVSIGNMRDLMPEFRDVSDITTALRLSFFALLISAGPLFLCAFLIPGASMLTRIIAERPTMETVHAAQPPEPAPAGEAAAEALEPEATAEPESAPGAAHVREIDEPESRAGIAAAWALVIVLCLIWWILYTPVALTVAALSKSVLSTINPVIGADTIRKMGTTYWQALAIYVVIVVVQSIAGFVLGYVPLAGSLVASFIDAYGYLAIGCTLGLAVFKKAVELGWD